MGFGPFARGLFGHCSHGSLISWRIAVQDDKRSAGGAAQQLGSCLPACAELGLKAAMEGASGED